MAQSLMGGAAGGGGKDGGWGFGGKGAGKGQGKNWTKEQRKANGKCKSFEKYGSCSYGESCKFDHDGDTPEAAPAKKDAAEDNDSLVPARVRKRDAKDENQNSGKLLDFEGRKALGKAHEIVRMAVAKKIAKKMRALENEGEDTEDFENRIIVAPKDIAEFLTKIAKRLGLKAKLNGSTLPRTKATRAMKAALMGIEGLGTEVSSSGESEVEEKKNEDKFDRMMEKMIEGMTMQGEENRRVMQTLLSNQTGKGKTRSPNGKLRKTPGGASSTSAGSSGGASSGGSLAARLFENDDDDEEEEGEEENDDVTEDKMNRKKLLAISMLEKGIQEAFERKTPKWNNKDPERAFSEDAPLKGLERFCGPNTEIGGTIKIDHNKLVLWLHAFDQEDFNKAMSFVDDLNLFWKSWQSPGKRLDLILRTHNVEIQGTSVLRKPWCLAMCATYARKMINHKNLPTMREAEMEFDA